MSLRTDCTWMFLDYGMDTRELTPEINPGIPWTWQTPYRKTRNRTVDLIHFWAKINVSFLKKKFKKKLFTIVVIYLYKYVCIIYICSWDLSLVIYSFYAFV